MMTGQPSTTSAKTRREYNTWVATETLEDYALRFAPKSFRKWPEWLVANTATGGLSFLALEAIGGSLVINYGFINSFWAIVVVGVVIFLTGLPISYYAAKYNLDIDLLTRGAGFGYIGSTITSLIYASFTFIFFALEAAVMAQALELYFQIALWMGYIICSLVIIPLVFFGMTLINRLQLWTQPIWLILLVLPYICIGYREPSALSNWVTFVGAGSHGAEFNPLLFGAAATVSFSLIAQIGEQVDYLRFLPDSEDIHPVRWWLAVIFAGPGWMILGCIKQLGGAFLTTLAVAHGVSVAKANEPTNMYRIGFEYVFANPETALAVTILFVLLSQVKINVTNAYAGSLAWSNFFSRLTHNHPGRVVWLVFNVAIALLMMELGIFSTLEAVLGLYSNVAIAWVGALVADLLINKPLGLSPPGIEFKRAHLYTINPVGVGATLIASLVAMAAFVGLFGEYARAFAPFIALGSALVLAPAIAWVTQGKYYIAREVPALTGEVPHALRCCMCQQTYELQDMAACPVYNDAICSLCCTLDSRCHDVCKHPLPPQLASAPGAAHTMSLQGILQTKLSPQLGRRLLRFLWVALLLSSLVAATLGGIYYQQVTAPPPLSQEITQRLTAIMVEIYAVFVVLIGIGAWWLVLTQESRSRAQDELDKQNLQLQQEVTERQLAEAQLHEQAQQLEHTLESLQQARDQLIQTEKIAALGRLVAGIAHEVNTPLGIGVTATSLLVEKTNAFALLLKGGILKRSELEKFLKTAQQSSQIALKNLERAAELIQSFKQVAVDQSSELERVFTVRSYLDEILLQLRPQLKTTRHTVVIDGSPTASLKSFPGAFSQIVTNLIMNSIIHAYTTDDRGVIKLTFYQCDRQFVLIYQDDGCGIPPDNLGKIFEPFFTTKRGQGGSGLGLHIVYNLVTRKLGGTIRCDSQLGVGTQFVIALPID